MENLRLHNQDNPCQQKSTSDRKFVIFDLDGTLIDSFECVLRNVNKALDSFSIPHVDIPPDERHGDIAVIFSKAKVITNGIIDFCDFKERFDTMHFEDCIESITIINSSYNLLLKYREDGVRIIVLTNKYQPIAEKICKIFFANLCDIIIGRECHDYSKTKECQLMHYLSNNKINPNRVICYYGDSVEDCIIAKSLGTPFYATQYLCQ